VKSSVLLSPDQGNSLMDDQGFFLALCVEVWFQNGFPSLWLFTAFLKGINRIGYPTAGGSVEPAVLSTVEAGKNWSMHRTKFFLLS